MKTIEGYARLNFEVACFISFRCIPKNHFMTTAEAAADIDDSTKRKRIRVSLKNGRNSASDGVAAVYLVTV